MKIKKNVQQIRAGKNDWSDNENLSNIYRWRRIHEKIRKEFRLCEQQRPEWTKKCALGR